MDEENFERLLQFLGLQKPVTKKEVLQAFISKIETWRKTREIERKAFCEKYSVPLEVFDGPDPFGLDELEEHMRNELQEILDSEKL
jgi:hypothetical protein